MLVRLRIPLQNRAIDDATPDRHRLRQSVRHTLTRTSRVDEDKPGQTACYKWDRAGTGACYLPSLLNDQRKQMQIGTAKIETPVIGMPIGGLEVCRRVGRL